MKELYYKKYKEYFKDILDCEYSNEIYPPINHELDLTDNEVKRKLYELEILSDTFIDNIRGLNTIGSKFAKEIKEEYANKEMDLLEYFSIVYKKEIKNNSNRISKKIDEIKKINYKTKSNFHMLEMIYHFHNNKEDIENESLKLLIDSIAEYEHSINEHNFFKTILFSRYVQEHLVHFVEERVNTLVKKDHVFEQVLKSFKYHKGHSHGVKRVSLPDLLDVFLKSNRYITHHFISSHKLKKLTDTAHDFWKVSSYFLHAGNFTMAEDKYKVDSFKRSFDLIRHNGLHYMFDFIEYLMPILYKDEWSDLIHIMSSSPLEFNEILKIDQEASENISKNKYKNLHIRNFRKKGIYANLTDEEIKVVSDEYHIPNKKFDGETSEHFHLRIYSFLEANFNESNDVYEKAIILRRTSETISHMIMEYHEHFDHFGELATVRNIINGIPHVDYDELVKHNFTRVTPLIIDLNEIDRLHKELLRAFAHIAQEHIEHMKEKTKKHI